MATRKPNKAIYKVYIKSIDKYYSASKSKATWSSLSWALSAADDARRYYRLKSEDIEIHEFPIVDAIKHSYLEILEREQEAIKEKQEKKKAEEERRRERQQIEQAQAVIRSAQENMENAISFLESKGIEVNTQNVDKYLRNI